MLGRIKNIESYAKGKRGLVAIGVLGRKKVALKTHNPKSSVDTVEHEAKYLQKMNKRGIGPRFLGFEKGTLIMEFIEGTSFRDLLPTLKKTSLKKILRELLRQARVMDTMHISKGEMLRPYKNVLITPHRVVLIDFERCRETLYPTNVTQFCQFLGKIQQHYERVGMHVDPQACIALGQEYKKEYNERVYKKILALIK